MLFLEGSESGPQLQGVRPRYITGGWIRAVAQQEGGGWGGSWSGPGGAGTCPFGAGGLLPAPYPPLGVEIPGLKEKRVHEDQLRHFPVSNWSDQAFHWRCRALGSKPRPRLLVLSGGEPVGSQEESARDRPVHHFRSRLYRFLLLGLHFVRKCKERVCL